MSPLEIIEYIKWRKKFYNKSESMDLLVTETHKGFLLSKPQKMRCWCNNIYTSNMERLCCLKINYITKFLGNMYQSYMNIRRLNRNEMAAMR